MKMDSCESDKNNELRPKASRVRRASVLSVVIIAFVLSVAGVFVTWGIGQTVSLPDWLRDRIEARLEQNLDGFQIAFGDVEMVVNRGWRPRVRLRDVTLSEPNGRPVLELADAQASLAMRPLLKGLLQPKSISLNGAHIILRRELEGQLSLALGREESVVREAATVPELIEEWDRRLVQPPFSALVSVEMEALTLRYDDLMQDRSWVLDGGQINLSREGQDLRVASSFSLLSGGAEASTIEMNYFSHIGETEAEIGISVSEIPAQDVAAQSVAFAWLDVLRAPISGSLRASVEADGKVGPSSATLQIGAGVLQPNEATKPIPFDGARTYVNYSPADQLLIFDEISVDSAWGAGSADGHAYLDVADGRFESLIGQLSLRDLTLNPDDLYETPIKVPNALAEFRLELAPFRVSLGQALISLPESQLHLSGQLDAEQDGWTLAIDGSMDSLTPEELKKLWPERAATKPRKWVSENVSGGQIRDADLALRIQPNMRPNIYLDFSFEDSVVKFLKTQPPITGASGQVTMNDRRFVVTATKGEVFADQGGPLDVTGTSFIIPDTSVKPDTPAIVRVKAEGTVTSVLSLLDRPPLSVLKETPLPVDMADGSVALTGTLALPMRPKVPFELLEFHLDGELRDIASSVLVPGQTITADRMALSGTQNSIALSGSGFIGAVPVTANWSQALGKDVPKASRLDGTIELSPKLIETFGIGLPDNSVSGSGAAQFTLDLVSGQPPRLKLNSDLRGVGLSLAALGWSKPQSANGNLEISGQLGERVRIDRIVLEGAGLAANGAISTKADGGLDRALFSSVRLGNWLDASVELIGRGGTTPEVRVLNGTLDMRNASFGGADTSSAQDANVLNVSLDRLQVSDGISLTDFSGKFQTAGGLRGPFQGKVNGQTVISGEVSPRSGRSSFRIRANDAGGVVRSAGLLSMARGGSFDMSLTPGVRAGEFDGNLEIKSTRIYDAPAIAALLNAISVVGLLDELSGQGILFSNVEARFRLTPSQITVFESNATGPSMGLSMDGTFNVPTNTLRMQGVISPLYIVNQLGNLIARKGEGVFGFNYSLTGPAKDPKVSVNPLSALAPGFLRDILRSSPPPVDEFAPAPEQKSHTRPDDANSGR